MFILCIYCSRTYKNIQATIQTTSQNFLVHFQLYRQRQAILHPLKFNQQPHIHSQYDIYNANCCNHIKLSVLVQHTALLWHKIYNIFTYILKSIQKFVLHVYSVTSCFIQFASNLSLFHNVQRMQFQKESNDKCLTTYMNTL